MRNFLLIPAILVAACAVTPQEMAAKSSWDVCRLTMGGPYAQAAEYERSRRALDCAPLYPAIQARQASEAAATQQFINTLNPPRPAPRQAVNCTSYRLGNTIQTDCR